MNNELDIKVCGMRQAQNIRDVEALGIDMMGFIFWPHSSRFVSQKPDYLPSNCKRVGVFVDEDLTAVRRHIEEYQLDMVQLHGHESPQYASQLGGVTVVKAFNIATADDFRQTEAYEGICQLFLFDTKGRSVGGNGEQFDWTVLSSYRGTTPFLLSGGIGPDDAEKVRQLCHPMLAGIDLNSRFELSPALKDSEALRAFIAALRNK